MNRTFAFAAVVIGFPSLSLSLGCGSAESSSGDTADTTTTGCPVGETRAFAERVPVAVGDAPIAIAAVDLNGDGHLDLAVTEGAETTGYVELLHGAGDGTFAAAGRYATLEDPLDIAAADLNADGRPDLAVATAEWNTVSVLVNESDGTLATHLYEADNNPGALALADLDGDGKLDLAVANLGGRVSVLKGLGGGEFAAPVHYTASGGPASIAAADLDGDSDVDLAVMNKDGKLSLFWNRGDGTFEDASNQLLAIDPVGVGIFTDRVPIVAADLNGDGTADLAIGASNDTRVTFLFTYDGKFGVPLMYDVGLAPWSLAAADLNGDGKTDLAVTGGFSHDAVSILYSTGYGNFEAPVLLDAGHWTAGVVAADVNEDGKTDLAVANPFDHTVSVLLSTCVPWEG